MLSRHYRYRILTIADSTATSPRKFNGSYMRRAVGATQSIYYHATYPEMPRSGQSYNSERLLSSQWQRFLQLTALCYPFFHR